MIINTSTYSLFDFNMGSDINQWFIVNDGVMGGYSSGHIVLDEAGHGIFFGGLSLANNGGFSSVRYRSDRLNILAFDTIILRVSGDGKRYQFRIKSSRYDSHSYISYFETNGEWQDIEIKLADMYPTFRGRRLDLPNFEADYINEVAFLIANGEAESFRLAIDEISLR